MSSGPADDQTVRMAKMPQPAVRARSAGLIWAGGGAAFLLLAGLAAWLVLSSGKPVPSVPVAAAPSVIVPAPAVLAPPAPRAPAAPRFAIRSATEAEIAADIPSTMTVFRFDPNPRVLVLDFPDLLQQGLMLNRIAALVEKKALPRDRLLTNAELDAAIAAGGDTMETYYYGHDYAAADLARFFALADAQHLTLRPEEETLRSLLTQEGLLRPGATGAIISIPRAGSGEGVDQALRAGILHHELSHGEFFTNPVYADYAHRFWREGLDDAARDAFRRYLASQEYDPGLSELIINEMQAYLMHTPDPRLFSARVLGMDPVRFSLLQGQFLTGMPPGWLRDCTPAPAGFAPAGPVARP